MTTDSNLHAETTGQILISYSRRDRNLVKKLYADLENLGFSLWRDLHDIEGGEPFWEEIKQGIDACESVVLCMSNDSLTSKFVQMEWHYARQQGKRVVPVVINDVNFDHLPRWMGRIDWKDFRKGQPERDVVWASFIKTLNTPYEGRKVPFMPDKLPEYFVNRPKEFENMVNALVNTDGAVAITAGVQGAGGFGKTTLALALCHDTRIQGAFDDGILWVTLGENPSKEDRESLALDLITLITGERSNVTNHDAIKAELQKAIGDSYMLLVIDDLWEKNHANLFLTDNPNSAVLVTTRFDYQLPDKTDFKQNVDAMATDEAVQLLTWNIDDKPSSPALLPQGEGSKDSKTTFTPEQMTELQTLAERLGEWAVIIRLTNATLRKRIQRGDSLDKAIIYANKALDKRGLFAFDNANEGERNSAVKATIEVSLELLDNDTQAQFAQLAIFPEDADIPFATLEKLWQLDNFDTEEVTEALQDASLLANYDLEKRIIRLHDVIRQYLIKEHEYDLTQWQADFVQNLGDLTTLSNEYEWTYIAYHLFASHQQQEFVHLLSNIVFLNNKFIALNVNALLSDFSLISDNVALDIIQNAIMIDAHITDKNKQIFVNQLYARVIGYARKHDAIKKLIKQAFHENMIALVSTVPTLSQAGGALVRSIPLDEGGDDLAIIDDETIVFADDKTVKVVKWRENTMLQQIKFDETVNNLIVHKNHIIVGVKENIFIWDWENNKITRTLVGHTDIIRDIVTVGDNVISAGHDKTVKVWSLTTGQVIIDYKQHKGWITCLQVNDEVVLSASEDNHVHVWDWRTGQTLRAFRHNRGVWTLAISGDYAISSGRDDITYVWNWRTLQIINKFHYDSKAEKTQYNNWYFAYMFGKLAILGDFVIGNTVTFHNEKFFVWNWRTGQIIHEFTEHEQSIKNFVINNDLVFSIEGMSGSISYNRNIPNRHLHIWKWQSRSVIKPIQIQCSSINISDDYIYSALPTLKNGDISVWRWANGDLTHVMKGHQECVNDIVIKDDFIISCDGDEYLDREKDAVYAGEDNSIVKVWNRHTGEVFDFTDHNTRVIKLATKDDFVLSLSFGVIKIWHRDTGQIMTEFQPKRYTSALAVSDDFVLSASTSEKTVQIWRWDTGQIITNVLIHRAFVNDIAVQGHWVFTASRDTTVKVWHRDTWDVVTNFTEHTASVNAICVQGKVAFSASSDYMIKVWRWDTGEVLTQFQSDASFDRLAYEPNHRVLVASDQKYRPFVFKISGLSDLLNDMS